MMKSILLVDDNVTLLKQISLQLASSFHVIMAKSGAQALSIASRMRPDIVLLDVDMPEMDGFATISAFKADPLLSDIPVIFLTANHDPETQIRALQSGGVDFIKKPFEGGVLRHRIQIQLRLAEYQHDLESKLKDLEDTIITSFAELIECRDGHSGGHVQRTCTYVRLLGKLLLESGVYTEELDMTLLELIARASALHDVGKIGVSDVIMLKPGNLSAEEYDQVKKHTLIGAETLRAAYMLAPIPFLHHAAVIAENHHERFDGLGYPHGLQGEDIPLSARLTSVANVYDALISRTIYRPGMAHEAACRIIEKGAGSEFDPQITSVFLENEHIFAKASEVHRKTEAARVDGAEYREA